MTPPSVSMFIVFSIMCMKLLIQCYRFEDFQQNTLKILPYYFIPCPANNKLIDCNFVVNNKILDKTMTNIPTDSLQNNYRSNISLMNRRLLNFRTEKSLNKLSRNRQKSNKINLMLNKSIGKSNTSSFLGKLLTHTGEYYQKHYSTPDSKTEVTTPINLNRSTHYNVKDGFGLDITTMSVVLNTEHYDTVNKDHRDILHNSLFESFTSKLDELDRKFYKTTFTKLLSISPADRHQNGISFVQSGFLLYLMLLGISMDVDSETRKEIDQCINFYGSDFDRIKVLKQAKSWLPKKSEELKFRLSTRLALYPPTRASGIFKEVAKDIGLKIYHFNGSETAENLANILNRLIELDSGGAMQDTFDEDELSQNVQGVLMGMAYIRGRWRSAPTLLNGTHPFYDANTAPQRSARMIRVNDIIQYAYLNEWDAEAVELSYATSGLSLLMLIPRGKSLKTVVEKLTLVSVSNITRQMFSVRAAVTIPLYTLRMTLLLPGKLEEMGINRLFDVSNNTNHSQRLKLSHAIQRLMFWSEAGRNAFKDDGIEWDETPELEVVINRPYIFFVRWHNVTLMTGNFVL